MEEEIIKLYKEGISRVGITSIILSRGYRTEEGRFMGMYKIVHKIIQKYQAKNG